MPPNSQELYRYRIVVDKARWLRGKQACDSPYLVDPKTGNMDITAMMMISVGYSKSHLANKRWPSQVVQALGRSERIIPDLAWLVSKAQADTEECVSLLTINDDPTIDDDTRIEKLKTIMNQHNFGLIVTDTSKPKEEKKEEPLRVNVVNTGNYIDFFDAMNTTVTFNSYER